MTSFREILFFKSRLTMNGHSKKAQASTCSYTWQFGNFTFVTVCHPQFYLFSSFERPSDRNYDRYLVNQGENELL